MVQFCLETKSVKYWGLGDGKEGQYGHYFANLEFLVVEGRIADLVTTHYWKTISNKKLYMDYTKDSTITKVEIDAGFSFDKIWWLINLPVLTGGVREIAFLAFHNKLPVRERLFRVGMAPDPYCCLCDSAQICDILHVFCSCDRVKNAWGWIRQSILSLVKVQDVSNWYLINFLLPDKSKELEAVWLIGNYSAKVWELTEKGTPFIKERVLFGYLGLNLRQNKMVPDTGWNL